MAEVGVEGRKGMELGLVCMMEGRQRRSGEGSLGLL